MLCINFSSPNILIRLSLHKTLVCIVTKEEKQSSCQNFLSETSFRHYTQYAIKITRCTKRQENMAHKPRDEKVQRHSLNLGIMIKLTIIDIPLCHYAYVLYVTCMHVQKCVPVWGTCICASACKCMCRCIWKPMLGFFFNCCLLYIQRQGLKLNMRVTNVCLD